MDVVIVYESMFGNTRVIAEAIAGGLADVGTVSVGSVEAVAPQIAKDTALIVAGGPTHAHGMVSARTKQAAVKDKKHRAEVSGSAILRDWIAQLPDLDCKGVAFDTRFRKPRWLTGSAAKGIARKLRARGCTVVRTESFFVAGSGGPLEDGERERAVDLGRALADELVAKDQAAQTS